MAGGAFAAVDAVKHLKLVDPRLGMIIESVGKYTIDKEPEPFRSLVEAIIYQQLAGSAADTIFRRFLKIYGGRFLRLGVSLLPAAQNFAPRGFPGKR